MGRTETCSLQNLLNKATLSRRRSGVPSFETKTLGIDSFCFKTNDKEHNCLCVPSSTVQLFKVRKVAKMSRCEDACRLQRGQRDGAEVGGEHELKGLNASLKQEAQCGDPLDLICLLYGQ